MKPPAPASWGLKPVHLEMTEASVVSTMLHTARYIAISIKNG